MKNNVGMMHELKGQHIGKAPSLHLSMYNNILLSV